MITPLRLLVCALASALSAPQATRAETLVDGPVSAEVVRVIDGDTILVLARPWPQQTVEVYVRLRGVDTPELKSKCTQGREVAQDAKHLLESLAAASAQVKLSRIAADKYFGRIVADVVLADGRDPAREMITAGFARPYAGSGQKNDLCASG